MKAPAVFCPEFIWAMDNLTWRSEGYIEVKSAFDALWARSKATMWAAERDHPPSHSGWVDK